MKKLTIKAVHKIPCLILEWHYKGEKKYDKPLFDMFGRKIIMFVWYCEYYLNLPLEKGDIRLEGKKESYLKASLGGTTCTGNSKTQIRNDGSINTPWRDGKHIEWDAELLKLPMFVISEGKIQKLVREDNIK